MVSERVTEMELPSASEVEKVATTEPLALPASSSVKLLVLSRERLGALFSAMSVTEIATS